MSDLAYTAAVIARSQATADLIQRQSGLQCIYIPSADTRLPPIDAAFVLIAGWEVDGFGTCKRLRAESSIPIILVVDKASPRMSILGLQAGADLVLGKGGLGQELRAHVKALMRRCVMPVPRDAYRLLRYSTF